MASLCKVLLIGNLTKDPETRYMTNGEAVTNITVATSKTWKDANGQKQEKSEFHRVTFYRKLAEIVAEYLKKGRSVYVEGELETRKWTDKNGIDRYTTEIIATDMKMLGSKPAEMAQSNQPSRSQPPSGFDDIDPEDLPF